METASTPRYLRGLLSSVRNKKWSGGWGIATFVYENDGKKHRTTLTGPLAGFTTDDHVEVMGAFVTNPRYGEQFEAVEVVRVLPDRLETIIQWLYENLPHIGKVRAREIVAHFGPNFFKIFETEEWSEKLMQIKGVAEMEALDIYEAWAKHKGRFLVFNELAGYGLTALEIKEAISRGLSTGDVKSDPFCLYYLEAISFSRLLAVLDTHFEQFLDGPELSVAALHSITLQKCDETGSTAVHSHKALKAMREAFDHAPEEHELARIFEDVPNRLEMFDGFLMPAKYARAEDSVANFIRDRLKRK